MEEENRCPFCGTKLIKDGKGNILCPNCGLIKLNELNGDEKRTYIGWKTK